MAHSSHAVAFDWAPAVAAGETHKTSPTGGQDLAGSDLRLGWLLGKQPVGREQILALCWNAKQQRTTGGNVATVSTRQCTMGTAKLHAEIQDSSKPSNVRSYPVALVTRTGCRPLQEH